MASWHGGGLVLWVHRVGSKPSAVTVEYYLELLHPTQPRRLRVAHCACCPFSVGGSDPILLPGCHVAVFSSDDCLEPLHYSSRLPTQTSRYVAAAWTSIAWSCEIIKRRCSTPPHDLMPCGYLVQTVGQCQIGRATRRGCSTATQAAQRRR